MLQIRVIFDTLQFHFDNLYNVLFYLTVVAFNLLFHFILALLVYERKDLRYLLIGFGFCCYLVIIHHDFSVENLCSMRSSKLSDTEPTNIPCVKVEILEAGIRLSNCVEIEVDLSLRLMVIL